MCTTLSDQRVNIISPTFSDQTDSLQSMSTLRRDLPTAEKSEKRDSSHASIPQPLPARLMSILQREDMPELKTEYPEVMARIHVIVNKGKRYGSFPHSSSSSRSSCGSACSFSAQEIDENYRRAICFLFPGMSEIEIQRLINLCWNDRNGCMRPEYLVRAVREWNGGGSVKDPALLASLLFSQFSVTCPAALQLIRGMNMLNNKVCNFETPSKPEKCYNITCQFAHTYSPSELGKCRHCSTGSHPLYL